MKKRLIKKTICNIYRFSTWRQKSMPKKMFTRYGYLDFSRPTVDRYAKFYYDKFDRLFVDWK